MAWQDRLVPADFDGAPFKVMGVTQKAGRRTVVQEFPGRRRVEVQDLSGDEPGGNALEFSVQAYLIGPNYDFDRDVLEAALREGGVKPITIPWRGTKRVTVIGDITTSEVKGEGGYCTINFTCIEDVPETPFSRTDRSATLQADADSAILSAKGDLSSRFSVTGLPSVRRVTALEALTTASDAMATASASIANVAGQVNEAAATVTAFSAAAEGLMSAPENLADELAAVVSASLGVATTGLEALEDAAASPLRLARFTDFALRAALDVFAFADGFGTIGESTPSGEREAENRAAIVDATRIMSMAEACRLLTMLPFESHAQAVAARALVVDAFDSALDSIGDGLFGPALTLQASAIAHLDEVAATLPELRTYTTERLTSAYEVAHEFYGDGARGDEVADRNGIGAPLFIPAGTTLELLGA